MDSLLWISVLLLLHGSHSYVLLTANVEDVDAIAKQIVASPIAGQISRILRRAANIFSQQLRANEGNPQHILRSSLRDLYSFLDPGQDRIDGANNRRSNSNTMSQSKRAGEKQEPPRDRSVKSRRMSEFEEHGKDQEADHTEGRAKEDGHKFDSNQYQSDESREDDMKKPRDQQSHQNTETRSHTDEVVALGKNASLYLDSIKKIIENI